ncbi:MAG: hypothetical protein HY537_11225 [Deltaproteobacteria bacterium]|nr:hypothetical protein [Deltaproteobacteria bacterium]
MAQKKRNSILTVDVTIRGSFYAFSLSKVLKWLAVLGLVAERLFRYLHQLTA